MTRPHSCPMPSTVLLLLALLAAAPVAAQNSAGVAATAVRTNPPPRTLIELQTRLSNHIAHPRFAAAQWGIKVVSLESGATWFEHQAGKFAVPASNTKLFTGALALDRLGPDFRIRTSLYARTPPDAAGRLAGDLIVYGRGDPGFSTRFQTNAGSVLTALADRLVAAGVRHIEGDVIGDESFFRAEALGAGWSWDDLEAYYSAEISALSLHDNTLDVVVRPGAVAGHPCRITLRPATAFLVISNLTVTATNAAPGTLEFRRPLGQNVIFVEGQLALDAPDRVETMTVHRPAAWFVEQFLRTLAERKITVGGGAGTRNWRDRVREPFIPGQFTELGFVESPPLSVLLAAMEKPSQNLHAQLLLLQVGARSRLANTTHLATDKAGIAELRAFLAEAGLRHGVHLEEGSGLSRRHLVTPSAITALLRHMHTHRWADYFREALPIAGVDGTLRTRMQGTPAAGNVRAKTGTLENVNALSGFVTTQSGERLAFAFLLNHYNGGRDDLDALAILLASYAGAGPGHGGSTVSSGPGQP